MRRSAAGRPATMAWSVNISRRHPGCDGRSHRGILIEGAPGLDRRRASAYSRCASPAVTTAVTGSVVTVPTSALALGRHAAGVGRPPSPITAMTWRPASPAGRALLTSCCGSRHMGSRARGAGGRGEIEWPIGIAPRSRRGPCATGSSPLRRPRHFPRWHRRWLAATLRIVSANRTDSSGGSRRDAHRDLLHRPLGERGACRQPVGEAASLRPSARRAGTTQPARPISVCPVGVDAVAGEEQLHRVLPPDPLRQAQRAHRRGHTEAHLRDIRTRPDRWRSRSRTT